MALKLVEGFRNVNSPIGFRQQLGIEGEIVYAGTAPIIEDDGEPDTKVDRETGEILAHRHYLAFTFAYTDRVTGLALGDSFICKYWMPGDDPEAIPYPELVGKAVDFEGEQIMWGANVDSQTGKPKLWGSFSFTEMFEAGTSEKASSATKAEAPKAAKVEAPKADEPVESKSRFAAVNTKA